MGGPSPERMVSEGQIGRTWVESSLCRTDDQRSPEHARNAVRLLIAGRRLAWSFRLVVP